MAQEQIFNPSSAYQVKKKNNTLCWTLLWTMNVLYSTLISSVSLPLSFPVSFSLLFTSSIPNTAALAYTCRISNFTTSFLSLNFIRQFHELSHSVVTQTRLSGIQKGAEALHSAWEEYHQNPQQTYVILQSNQKMKTQQQ